MNVIFLYHLPQTEPNISTLCPGSFHHKENENIQTKIENKSNK